MSTPPPLRASRLAPASPAARSFAIAAIAAIALGGCGDGGGPDADPGTDLDAASGTAPGAPPDGDRLAVGDPAPDVTFVGIDGTRPRLAELGRAVLVSFWATDCRICLEEAPALAALRERLAPRGFELVSVAMPYDRPDLVLERAGSWRHPVALDIDGATLAAFEPVPGTPTAVLVGPAGTVLARWSGPADVAALEARLDALLPPAAAPAAAG